MNLGLIARAQMKHKDRFTSSSSYTKGSLLNEEINLRNIQ